MAKLIAGVGMGPGVRRTVKPLPASTSATAWANRSPNGRVS